MGDGVQNVSFQSMNMEENSLFPVRSEFDEGVREQIDSNVQQVIQSAYEKSKAMVLKHKDLILKVLFLMFL